MKRILKYLKNKKYRFDVNKTLGFYKHISDSKFIKKQFKINMGYKLNLDNPITFNEKLQWLKLYYHKNIFTQMVDKYEAKNIVQNIIGSKYIIPTIGIWDNFYEIDFNTLPNKFVMKCTHNSGSIIICKDKIKFNYLEAKQKIEKSLKSNYYFNCREWPYKNVKPRIIIEEYIENNKYTILPVYKFFCFNGEPKIVQVVLNDKTKNETINYYDMNWQLLEIKQNYPNYDGLIEKPKNFDKMIEIASKLSKNTSPFIRIDLYSTSDNIYFSEFTFFSDAGYAKFDPTKWDVILGDFIKLPEPDIKSLL